MKSGWGRMNWNWRDNQLSGTQQAPWGQQSIEELSELKMFLIFAYDRHGILTSHKVKSGKTINGKHFEECIKKTLRQAIRRKRLEILAAGPIILHDNATPRMGWCHW